MCNNHAVLASRICIDYLPLCPNSILTKKSDAITLNTFKMRSKTRDSFVPGFKLQTINILFVFCKSNGKIVRNSDFI